MQSRTEERIDMILGWTIVVLLTIIVIYNRVEFWGLAKAIAHEILGAF